MTRTVDDMDGGNPYNGETRKRCRAPVSHQPAFKERAVPEFDYTDYGPKYAPIPGFDGYRVGTDGSVWTKRGSCGRSFVPLKEWNLMKLKQSNKGYLIASIRRNGKRFHITAHRLVLTSFVGNPANGLVCRHAINNPADNRLCNLSWGTQRENILDKNAHGTMARGSQNGMAKLKESDVIEIVSELRAGKSSRSISRKYAVSHTSILRIARGDLWRHLTGI